MIHNSRTAIEDKVKEIKDCLICYINTNKSKSYEDGLMGNNIGILLFLYHYSRFFNDEGIEDIAHSWAMYIVNNVHKVESYAYCDGWSGILMCFKYLKQQGYIDIDVYDSISDINAYISKGTDIYSQWKIYEFLYGSAGVGFYWLEEDNRDMINTIVSSMDENKELGTSGNGYKWKMRNFYDLGNAQYNLSMSHGITGMLLFLLRVCEKYEDETALRLLKGGISYLIAQENRQDAISVLPSFGECESIKCNSRLGWCYGDMSCAYRMYESGVYLKNSQLEQKAINIYKHCIGRKEKQVNFIVDAGLCHGSAGVAMGFDCIMKKSGDRSFKDITEYWIADTLARAEFEDGLAGYKNYTEKGWRNDYSLLTGVSGIGLMLLSFLSEDTNWYKFLLP